MLRFIIQLQAQIQMIYHVSSFKCKSFVNVKKTKKKTLKKLFIARKLEGSMSCDYKIPKLDIKFCSLVSSSHFEVTLYEFVQLRRLWKFFRSQKFCHIKIQILKKCIIGCLLQKNEFSSFDIREMKENSLKACVWITLEMKNLLCHVQTEPEQKLWMVKHFEAFLCIGNR